MNGDVRALPPRPFGGQTRNGRKVCPMCGELSTSKRGWWHPVCAQIWSLASSPQLAWVELRKEANCCWECRARGRTLEVEHVRPLWSLTPAERREFKWWLPFNLQLLCRECHRAKSAREARERYALQNPEGSLARRMRIQQHGYDPLDPNPQLWREAAS